VAASTSQIACVGTAELDDEAVAESHQRVSISNGMTQNGLTQNGLTQNGLTQNGLTQNGLTQNGLTQNSLVQGALLDPLAREALTFIVSCALPAGQSIDVPVDGTTYTFEGEIGLAPEWGQEGGSCDVECQEWVSACLLARVNYRGDHVEISIRGGDNALRSTRDERADYANREAAYFGNVFVAPQRAFACLSPEQTALLRVCGPSLTGCVVDVVGACDDVCGQPRGDGSFADCHDQERVGYGHGRGGFPEGTELYRNPITVFLE
jgi:hypothetical protein